jgi:hypothetical protein
MMWVVVVVAVGCLVMVIGVAALGFLRGDDGMLAVREEDYAETRPVDLVVVESADEPADTQALLPDLLPEPGDEWADELQHARGELMAAEFDPPSAFEAEYERHLTYLDHNCELGQRCPLRRLSDEDFDRCLNWLDMDYWADQEEQHIQWRWRMFERGMLPLEEAPA